MPTAPLLFLARLRYVLLATCVVYCLPSEVFAEAVVIVDAFSERRIEGQGELERQKYFALSHPGTEFDKHTGTPERYRRLVKQAQVSLGRRLGLVKWVSRPDQRVVLEDANRLGYTDKDLLIKRLKERQKSRRPSRQLREDFGPSLDVALHGSHNAYPEFMGKYSTKSAAKEDKPQWIPENADAAVELASLVLKHGYDNQSRPRYYEPVNEPHWSFPGDQRFIDWHLKAHAAVKRETPEVLVGGPCLSVCYFYGKQYSAFNGLKSFIDGTDASLDFYSFHCYDYYKDEDGRFGGRISSGLPLESMLDLTANYTRIEHGVDIKIVVSEHGGYGAPELIDSIAKREFPGEGFEWEMKKRSIADYNAVRSALANTMVFMEHPHVVLKAVPFILLESIAWDPKYKSVVYTPEGFKDRDNWVLTKRILFYDFFRGLRGRRLKAFCGDPDIQSCAFANGRKVYVVLNNLADKAEDLRLRVQPAEAYTIRRLGRNPDSTPYLREEKLTSLDGLRIKPNEALMLTLTYKDELPAARKVNEVVCYGNRVRTPVEGAAHFRVDVPELEKLDYAVLRVGVSRPVGADKKIRIKINREWLDVPLEDCAESLDYGERHGYASTKIVWVPKQHLREQNRVTVVFPDKKPGSVGSVVIRAGIKAS